MNFKKFIKAVGTGPKGNRDLRIEESFEAVLNFKEEQLKHKLGLF
jgi:anthranilate phosphoribosyltransferase